jgi:hypothetical protein
MREPANSGEHADVEAKRGLFRLTFARWDIRLAHTLSVWLLSRPSSARRVGEHLPRDRLRSPACEALGWGPLDGEGSSSSSLGDHSRETGEPLPLVAG